MGKIIALLGKSASGKDTIYQELKKVLKEKGVEEIVPYTSRAMREGEAEGVNYYFRDNEFFEKNKNKIIESRKYNTTTGVLQYGEIDDGNIDLDSKSYMIILTLEATISFQQYFGKDKIVPIYIEVQDGIRLRRSIEREELEANPNFKEVCRRFISDAEEFTEENINILKPAIISNKSSIENTLESIYAELKKEGIM